MATTTTTTSESTDCNGDEMFHSYNKSMKPLMEKRRRARINHCLEELKALLQSLMSADEAPLSSKMEKADILEMAVRYLRNLHRKQLQNACVLDPSTIDKFRSGYFECLSEVNRYLQAASGVSQESRIHLLTHLSNTAANCFLLNRPSTRSHSSASRPHSMFPYTIPIRPVKPFSPRSKTSLRSPVSSSSGNGPCVAAPLSPASSSSPPSNSSSCQSSPTNVVPNSNPIVGGDVLSQVLAAAAASSTIRADKSPSAKVPEVIPATPTFTAATAAAAPSLGLDAQKRQIVTFYTLLAQASRTINASKKADLNEDEINDEDDEDVGEIDDDPSVWRPW